ncbi:MAG: 50S ribosomal protein L3 [Oscillospiraceae bacterium]|jgi:large subunit ribosomal protein L3|nr:50S ribosomal protein L3 [Oscillospiraceae bacterium]
MQKAIIGTKVGMTQIFDEAGRVIPVTVIQAGPCVVTQVRTEERDGYKAVQLGYQDIAERKLPKGERGHLAAAGVMKKHLKEFALEGEYKTGDVIKADMFAAGDRVDVTGVSKGKGYAGVIKRHGFHRTAVSHGGGPVHRHQGSMGSATDSSRVFPGKKMAGHMGSEQVTVLNLDVVKADAELGVIAVRGAVPGPRGGLVYMRNSVKNA